MPPARRISPSLPHRLLCIRRTMPRTPEWDRPPCQLELPQEPVDFESHSRAAHRVRELH
ncbi:hypothetical protein K503DRAFT_773325 [Rhizopogon vinicolor AM-OR11-026]|uniref:Uncharacterized protein n=1 Tax=Rhizopogon vinicolor AM-OR11-026 TaxID=1314800 RepID=A0A1B7MSI7_9AGAM|nr:hypothetical protein K503DRAFT_773325 [Rhizopogon vinicolor AM-OR11-026]